MTYFHRNVIVSHIYCTEFAKKTTTKYNYKMWTNRIAIVTLLFFD